MRDKRGKHHQACLWQYPPPFDGNTNENTYGKAGGIVLSGFQMGRDHKGQKKMLRDFAGILETDGYNVHDKVGTRRVLPNGALGEVTTYESNL